MFEVGSSAYFLYWRVRFRNVAQFHGLLSEMNMASCVRSGPLTLCEPASEIYSLVNWNFQKCKQLLYFSVATNDVLTPLWYATVAMIAVTDPMSMGNTCAVRYSLIVLGWNR